MADTDTILAELQDQGARTIRLIEALQASNERQRESNELLKSRLDALTKFYHGVAQTLQDEGDETLLPYQNKMCVGARRRSPADTPS